MPAALAEIAAYADDLLQIHEVPDYPNAVNGVEVAHRGPVTKIAAAVDASQRAIAGAATEGANLLFVHHGLFWGGVQAITGPRYDKIAALVTHDIAVYGAHLPLDRHSSLGNNVLLARTLGIEPDGEFGHYASVAIGASGHTDLPTATLLARAHGGTARASAFEAGRRTRRCAIITGAGAAVDTLIEAREAGIDTLITGEGAHWTTVDAPEHGLVIIYAGHYATETLGVSALARRVAERFHLPWTFIATPTGS
jgi:dinuclear metal center YbgI/SA1388 family protein